MTLQSSAPGDGQRPPRPREVISRKGFVRRCGTQVIGSLVEPKMTMLLGGPVFFEIVRAACQLDLFGLLRRQPDLTLQEIAHELNLGEEPAKILLLGVVALKLVRKRGARYRCRSDRLARAFDRQDPSNMVAFVEWMHHIVYPSMQYFTESLREGRAAGLRAFPGNEEILYGLLDRDPQLQKVFWEAMNLRTSRVNREFLKRIDFSGFDNILDVGGGDGKIVVAIAQRCPRPKMTLLDFPSVAEKANRRFAERGLTDRLQAVGSDILHDDFPPGQDCVLFCHIMGNLSPENNQSMLRRAYAALKPGGMVCAYSAFTNDSETGPLSSAMLSAYFLCTVSGQGRQYTRRETAEWLQAAGFDEITRVKLQFNHGVILGRKP